MEYIQTPKIDGGACVFCRMIAATNDRENLILHRSKHCCIVLNRYPYNPGHLMVVPSDHKPAMADFSAAIWGEMMTLAGQAITCLQVAMKAEGANCGMNLGRVAGAGIADHLHFHVVPRWPGDTNFLPIFSGTKSMPEYLLETYDKLVPHFQKL